jgi:DNA polymerase III delta prime subunit
VTKTPETIYLIHGGYDGEQGLVWCDDPAPDSYCDPAAAVKYVRADVAMELRRLASMRSRAQVTELVTALRDAADIILADANTEQNYGSLCRIGNVLDKDSSAAWLLRQKAEKLDEVAKLVLDAGDLATVASIYEGLMSNAASLRQAAAEADKADKAGSGNE